MGRPVQPVQFISASTWNCGPSARIRHGWSYRNSGELLNASHASLRDCYGVSTPAVEETVERLRRAGAIGARIMGGGFGGHVLGLLPATATPPEGATPVAPGQGARLVR